ncbi:MAG: acyltransferase family protein [Saprospiraceae bacterium]
MVQLFPNYIRTMAALAVVQMHCIGGYLYWLSPEKPIDANWITADICYSCLRWATPFFVMLSGSFMLSPSRTEPTWLFLKKRIGRIMYPFLFLVRYLFAHQYRGNLYYMRWPDWADVWNVIVYKDVYYHLWFMPMIAGMYLLTPAFLRIYTRHATRNDLEVFLIMAFSITALQQWLPKFFFIKYIGWLGYVGFYVLGYYLSAFRLPNKKWIYGLALLMPVVTAIGTWYQSNAQQAYWERMYNYFSPNVAFMTFALFLFMRNFDWPAFSVRYPRINYAVNRFSKISFGVYFVHVLLIDVLKNGYLGIKVHPTYFLSFPVHSWYGTFCNSVL